MLARITAVEGFIGWIRRLTEENLGWTVMFGCPHDGSTPGSFSTAHQLPAAVHSLKGGVLPIGERNWSPGLKLPGKQLAHGTRTCQSPFLRLFSPSSDPANLATNPSIAMTLQLGEWQP